MLDQMEADPITPSRTESEFPIVALACSQGGLNALTIVLGGLPEDFPAAVIVLQHQSPDHPNSLAAILDRECRLPVTVARHQRPLAPATVIVVPAGKHALVTDNEVALINSNGPPPYRPSADLLLISLAVTAPQRTIAVILSGGGNDGATGATAIHDFGGTVVASDHESSENFGMPAAAIGRDDAVDYVVPVKEIADLLISLTATPRTRRHPWTPPSDQRP